jgi:hypothetical protein
VRERERERKREKERAIEGVRVCVCVCAREKERTVERKERERETVFRDETYTLETKVALVNLLLRQAAEGFLDARQLLHHQVLSKKA